MNRTDISKALKTNGFIDLESIAFDRKNRRLVIRKYSSNADLKTLIAKWLALAQTEGLEKIWVWGFAEDVDDFKRQGFNQEGDFPSPAGVPSISLAYYLTPKRGQTSIIAEENQLIEEIQRKPFSTLAPLPSTIVIKALTINDVSQISKLLTNVFISYPTPVNDPQYISKLIKGGCIFAGAFNGNQLISVASAYPEMDLGRCEMTDCATLPDFRGYNLTERILRFLESLIQESYTPYSLARARSFGMNRVFYKLGYTYKGRLINNCDIGGGFEDMNLWVRTKQ